VCAALCTVPAKKWYTDFRGLLHPVMIAFDTDNDIAPRCRNGYEACGDSLKGL
jgi:hypothetical protein